MEFWKVAAVVFGAALIFVLVLIQAVLLGITNTLAQMRDSLEGMRQMLSQWGLRDERRHRRSDPEWIERQNP